MKDKIEELTCRSCFQPFEPMECGNCFSQSVSVDDEKMWCVEVNGHDVALQSNDFEHDSRLRLDGDFEHGLAGKIKFAEELARKLNGQPISPPK